MGVLSMNEATGPLVWNAVRYSMSVSTNSSKRHKFFGVYTTRVLTPTVTRGEIKWRLGWIEARKMPIGEETARFIGN